MENVRRPASAEALSCATSAFDLDARTVQIDGDSERLGGLAAALGKVLHDLQKLDVSDAVSGENGQASGAEAGSHGNGAQPGSADAGKPAVGRTLSKRVSSRRVHNNSDDDISIDISLSDEDLSLDLDHGGTSPTPARVHKETCTRDLPTDVEPLHSARNYAVPVVVFVVGDEKKRILAHKDIVATRCPYVFASLGWNEDEAHDNHIILPELTPAGVWACLEFMYTAGVRFEANQVWQVFQAGMYLNLDALTSACADLILESVTDANTWGVLESGHLLESENLINAALDRVAERTRLVLASTDFGSPSVTSAALLKVVQRADLTIYEKELARAVLSQWVEHTKEPKESVDEVLRRICWPQVYEEDMELLSLAMKKRMLPDDVMVEVLKWVGGPPKSDKIPDLMKTRYRNWAFLMTHPRCPPSKFKDVATPKLSTEKSTALCRWVEIPELPSPFGVHAEDGDHAIVVDTYGRLNVSKAFSVEAWVKYEAEQGEHFDDCVGAIVSKHGTASGWELRGNRDRTQFLITLRDSRGGNATPQVWHEVVEVKNDECPKGKPDRPGWLHVAATFDGHTALVYVNGSNAGITRIPNYNTSGGDHRVIHEDVEMVHFFGHMCIGTNPHWKQRYINADICGVRIYTDRVKNGKQFKGAAES